MACYWTWLVSLFLSLKVLDLEINQVQWQVVGLGGFQCSIFKVLDLEINQVQWHVVGHGKFTKSNGMLLDLVVFLVPSLRVWT